MDNTAQEYINKMREAGKRDDEIKGELLKAGWNEKDIVTEEQNQQLIEQRPIKYKISIKLLVVGLLLFFLGIFISLPGLEPSEFGALVLIPGYILIIFGIFFIVGTTNKNLISFIIHLIVGGFLYFLIWSTSGLSAMWVYSLYVLMGFGATVIITSIITFYKYIKNTSQ